MSNKNIDRSFDGLLSPQEWEDLQRTVIDDPEARREYVEKRWLHAQLIAQSDSLSRLLPENDPITDAPKNRWLEIAAGIALLGVVTFAALSGAKEPTVATLIDAQGCRWEGSELPTNEGAKLGAGTLALAEGMATIQFDSGATVTLEAPSVLEVESAMRCRLVEGSVVADVPESAHGFTIDTEKMEVVDLGTRFGVTTTPIGGSHVFVFDGEVKVLREETEEPEHIFGGKSLHIGGTPSEPDQEVSRNIQPPSKSGNWTQISTATGRGKDVYLRRGDAHGPTGAHPLLMVKHTDLAPGNERRAVLTFDLSRMPKESLESARLALKVESSGLGFSSLVPDSKFAIYAASDSDLHLWRENQIEWNSAGAFVDEPISSEKFKRLAEFEIEKGSSHGIVEISSPEFGDFIKSHAGDFATILLVRESGELDKQGLVHAFASKEHPSGPAPTLWLQFATKK